MSHLLAKQPTGSLSLKQANNLSSSKHLIPTPRQGFLDHLVPSEQSNAGLSCEQTIYLAWVKYLLLMPIKKCRICLSHSSGTEIDQLVSQASKRHCEVQCLLSIKQHCRGPVPAINPSPKQVSHLLVPSLGNIHRSACPSIKRAILCPDPPACTRGIAQDVTSNGRGCNALARSLRAVRGALQPFHDRRFVTYA